MTLELLSAFGFGALITAFFQAFFNAYQGKKALSFQEKKEAYVGLLQAYHEVSVEGSQKAAKHFAYWQIRCDLVSDHRVRKAIQDMIDTSGDMPKRFKAESALKEALRRDLGISKSL